MNYWKTLEERFGQPVQVSQACTEGLVSGPKLAPGAMWVYLIFLKN